MSINWDDLKFALAIARYGTLSAAARALGTTQPTVSRRLDALELRLQAKLFDREASGLRPTVLASSLLDGLEQMDAGALSIQRQVAARDTGLSGEILVTSLDWLGDEVIAPMLARFGALHPGVVVELINGPQVFNLARREADLAFRFGAFTQENLIERRVGEVAYALYASDAYLQKHGLPDVTHGLVGHRLVYLDRAAGEVPHEAWLRALATRAHTVLHVNGLRAHLAVARDGVAMAVLPRLLGDREPQLRRVELQHRMPARSVRVGFHSDMRETPRIRALVDFVVQELELLQMRLNPGS
ncbi:MULTISPECIES: LysR family transcriptional regulator [unclassified Variovorax]|jgi:DNA-binding transcriptional LysR family regulator|uniref:LysR family transcriptional regulator n=1 Tax=unclassified Variovorax TaxID=663243 RepID=UPI000F7ED88C|nr:MULTISPECIES: LysR family transcriptional regulator [unclassified Variovorax]RSZ33835.1 LysR family transcriptional regulator [Variovorax sp. 553]RSZ34168.1 LysR family transcriptional regulator [Variovorax sp. 679]